MRASERVSAAVLAGTGFILASVVLFDAYEDWVIQGDPLWTALFENSLPLLLVGSLPYAAWRLYDSDRDPAYASSVAKWTLLGAGTMLLLASWVVGIQLLQGRLKPEMIVVQTTTVGAIAGLVAGHNTAEVERAREETERQKLRFESLFANSPSAIVALSFEDSEDTAGGSDASAAGDPVIENTNDAFEELFDYGGKDVTGRPLFEVIPPESPETRREMEAHVGRDEVYTTETTQFTTEGGKDFTLRLVPYGEDRAYALYQDISELKASQRELERTVDQLEKSNEQLQQFAYVASHDLQEPLRMVKSYVDLLETEYGDQLGEEADEYIEFAVDGAERMQRMIDDLLQYSRVETQASEFEPVDPGSVLEKTCKDLELRIAETDTTVTRADEFPAVEADPNQLGQLFQNLIKNAIDHAGEDPPEVHVGAERSEGGHEVVFSVADDGPGIPEAQQERVFEIFEQGGRDDDGTGIGLAVCQRIVNRHGGDIWVESTGGEGATFYFSLPAASARKQATADPQPQ